MDDKLKWNGLQQYIVPANESLTYREFLELQHSEPSKALAQLDAIFIHLSIVRMNQLAFFKKKPTISKEQFHLESLKYTWMKMRQQYNLSLNEMSHAHQYIKISEKNFLEDVFLDDIEEAWESILFVYDRFYLMYSNNPVTSPKLSDHTIKFDKETKYNNNDNSFKELNMTKNNSVNRTENKVSDKVSIIGNIHVSESEKDEKNKEIAEITTAEKSEMNEEVISPVKFKTLEERVVEIVTEPQIKKVISATERESAPTKLSEEPIEKRFFTYLLELTKLRESLVRDYTNYEKHWDVNDLMKITDCLVEDQCEETDTILHISRPTYSNEELTPPEVPNVLKNWIDFNVKSWDSVVTFRDKYKLVNEEGYLNFNDNTDRVATSKTYRIQWNDWAKNILQKKLQEASYNEFFELVSRFEREGESLELLYGRGIVTWSHPDPKVGSIRSPILLMNIELELDAKKGIIVAKVIDDIIHINREMLSSIRLPNIDRLESVYKNLKETNIINPDMLLFTEFINTISSQGNVYKNGEKNIVIQNNPAIYDEATFILRKKNTRVLRNDLENIIDLINKEELELNDSLQSLIYQNVKNPLTDQTSNEMSALLRNRNTLYFPLPANEQQVQIVERLRNNFGVTVQGPPGTGKTHTIANLVSHYLAEGKRVLITSQKENALKVLHEKIPFEIQDLCVSVLGGSRESFQEIEKSIRTLNEKLGELNIPDLNWNVENSLKELDESKREEARLRTTLRQYAELEGATLSYKDEELKRYEVAKRLSDTSISYDWIKDDVKLENSFPLSEPEFHQLWQLRNVISSEDLLLTDIKLPTQNQDIMNAKDFEVFINEGNKYATSEQEMKKVFEKYSFTEDESMLNDIIEKLSFLEENASLIENENVRKIFTELFAGESRKKHWVDLITFLNEQKDKAFDLNNQLITHDLKFTNVSYKQLITDLKIIENRLSKQKSVSSKMFTMLNSKLNYLIKDPVINDHPVQTLEDVKVIYLYLDYVKLKRMTTKHYNSNMKTIDNSFIDSKSTRFPQELEEQLHDLNLIKNSNETIQSLKDVLNVKGNVLLETSSITALKNEINFAKQYIKFQAWKVQYEQNIESIKALRKETQHPIFEQLYNALTERDVKKWNESIDKLYELHKNKKLAIELDNLIEVLGEVLPLTEKSIRHSLDSDLDYPVDFVEAFEMKKIETWLNETAEINQEAIIERLKSETDKQQKLIEKIVRDATWSSQLSRITSEQQRALSSWKSYIKRVGKGTGKYAHQHIANARKEMQVAQHAIPVWIMPITKVLENFPIQKELFDVIIFDESSQCDIFALNVMMRGKKSIVVGDDQQISPDAIGDKQEDVNDLVRRYVPDLPNAGLYDRQISLYEIAEQIFPKEGKLMLREHFRCVPEIIQFSNDLSYNGDMIPLRLPLEEEKINPPVMAIHVPDGYNDPLEKDLNSPEAEKIAEDILELIKVEQFDNQTIGVISLQGQKQHKLLEKVIREKIGDTEFVDRKIICGNPYDFQGDERDIIFLSMVIAPERGFRALTRLSDQQRFNVAASRARNQLRLYHSVLPEDLNTTDLRYKLLTYCKRPTRVKEAIENIMHLIESPFEKDVIELILAKGYRVTPQVKVGNFRIDLVIEGLRNRLAVEIDGEKWHGPDKFEADMERQAILERSGWKFWRVRGREFYLNRGEAMDNLWQTLDEMDIQPQLI